MMRLVVLALAALALAAGCRTAPRGSREEVVGDVKIFWPMNALKRSGDPHTLALKIEDMQKRPLSGYRVRWSLLDDDGRVEAHLGVREQKVLENATDEGGEAEVTIYRANQADGIKPVQIRVENPGGAPVAENSVYVTWSTCPSCHMFRKTGPAACAVGEKIVCALEIGNPGNDPMNETVVVDSLSEGFVFLESSLEPSYLDGPKAVWELGVLPAGGSRRIEVTLQAVRAGTWVGTAMLSVRDMQPKNSTTIITVTDVGN